jgi:thiazole synthase ThiGH ThiG subunit
MHRFFRAMTVTAMAGGAAAVLLAADMAAAQAPTAGAQAWSPARLPDGQPSYLPGHSGVLRASSRHSSLAGMVDER